MPKVGNVKYPYTKKGMQKAKQAAKKTGQKLKKSRPRKSY
jgi:type IV secretory pathway TrbL component